MEATPLLFDGTWMQQQKYESAEAFYQQKVAEASGCGGQMSGGSASASSSPASALKTEIAQARQNIQKALKDGSSGTGGDNSAILGRLQTLESENNNLRKVSQDLMALVKKLEGRVAALEKTGSPSSTTTPPAAETKPEPADEDSDDFDDMFGDDDDDSEDEELQKKLAAYNAKKANKPKVIAKSSIIMDVKPWDDETDMKALESSVRSITMDGLLWGAGVLKPVGYGIRKLQISLVVEDEKVSTEDLEEQICGFEDYVQSVDIVAFNKI